MNATLFRSRHALVAVGLVTLFIAFAVAGGAPLGRAPGHDRWYLITTGWVTLAAMVIVMAYVLRKYAHRGGYSPEFRMRVDHADIERADARIQQLRQRISAGSHASKKVVQAEADMILREEGVHKVNRALVTAGQSSGERFVVDVVPTEPLGRVAKWMHVHAYYGAAFGALLVLHSGVTPGSGFGWALAGLGYAVLLTGLVGIVLWAYGPSWLTARERDLSIEEANALSASLRRKRIAAIEALEPPLRGPVEQLASAKQLEPGTVQPVLQQLARSAPDRADELQDLMALLAQERAVVGELRELRRVRASFMAWRYVHIPAAILLCAAVLVHILSVLRY